MKGEPRRYIINHQKRGATWGRVHERFWSNVERGTSDACWVWRGACRPNGYGVFRWHQRQDGAHRVSWEIANKRQVPGDMQVLHLCDNPRCVNPAHLSIGSRSDNMQDMLSKGRGRWDRRHITGALSSR